MDRAAAKEAVPPPMRRYGACGGTLLAAGTDSNVPPEVCKAAKEQERGRKREQEEERKQKQDRDAVSARSYT